MLPSASDHSAVERKKVILIMDSFCLMCSSCVKLVKDGKTGKLQLS